jgi:hypothetical protein
MVIGTQSLYLRKMRSEQEVSFKRKSFISMVNYIIYEYGSIKYLGQLM